MPKLYNRDKLLGVHKDLCTVVNLAVTYSEIDLWVLEGTRTLARQKILLDKGATRTLKSRHLTGHAVDLGAYVGKQVRWDWPLYDKIAKAMKRASKELGIAVEWGGDWKSFKDGPHWQLPWKEYP